MNNTLTLTNTSNADKLYDYSGIVLRGLEALDKDKTISVENKEHIKGLLIHCNSLGMSKARLTIYLDKSKNIARLVRKDFKKYTRTDIKNVMKKITEKYTNSNSRALFVVTLKKIFGEYFKKPKLIDWIKTNTYSKQGKKESKLKRIENILTPQEVEQLINKADNPRDKALIGLIYYSATRIGEIINIQMKHIKFKEYITELTVYGKTGLRVIPIVECTKLLHNWLDAHGDKENKEAYVWINIGTTKNIANLRNVKKEHIKVKKNYGEHIGVRTVEKLLKKVGERVGITKKLNPHNFRHSRLTYLATRLTEAELKNYAGWTQSSKEAGTYVHLSNKDNITSMNKLYQLKKEDKQSELSKCFRCGWLNRKTLSVCENCAMALTSIKGADIDKKTIKQEKITKIMRTILEDDMFKKVLARYFIDKGMADYVKDLAEDEK